VHFASIHNNPPGVYTGRPALVANRFGAGRAIYAGLELESLEAHRDVFVNLVRALAERYSFEAEAPKAVEVTLFHQAERKRYIVNMINFQKELPNIPVEGIRVRVRLGDKRPEQLLLLPEETAVAYEVRDGAVEFTAPRLETFAMFALDYA
jgi:hypothetical protein